MKNIWRKMRDCWLDFWEDDELDMDKKHLSQHDWYAPRQEDNKK